MATVQETLIDRKHEPADDWAAWTDEYTWEIDDDFEPDPEDAAWWDSIARSGHGGDAPSEPAGAFSPLVWIEAQAAWHRSLVREEGDYQDLVATDLADVAIVLRDTRSTSARALVGRAGHPWSGLDLDAVRLPEARESHAADLLDEQAGVYLAMGTDLATLAAAAILRRADEVEAVGAQTLRDYHAALDARYDELAAQSAGLLGYPPVW